MSWLNVFKKNKPTSASLAKERLQIVISHQRSERNAPEYLAKLQQEILDVVAKYVEIDREQLKVNIEKDGEFQILDVNITLPRQH